jgi:hypothetical protein
LQHPFADHFNVALRKSRNFEDGRLNKGGASPIVVAALTAMDPSISQGTVENCSVASSIHESDADEKANASGSNKRKMSNAWSFMSTPSLKDISGGRKVHKAFDAPRKSFDRIIVLDFEWTCDNKVFSPSEIIEFPSVLLSGHPP